MATIAEKLKETGAITVNVSLQGELLVYQFMALSLCPKLEVINTTVRSPIQGYATSDEHPLDIEMGICHPSYATHRRSILLPLERSQVFSLFYNLVSVMRTILQRDGVIPERIRTSFIYKTLNAKLNTEHDELGLLLAAYTPINFYMARALTVDGFLCQEALDELVSTPEAVELGISYMFTSYCLGPTIRTDVGLYTITSMFIPRLSENTADTVANRLAKFAQEYNAFHRLSSKVCNEYRCDIKEAMSIARPCPHYWNGVLVDARIAALEASERVEAELNALVAEHGLDKVLAGVKAFTQQEWMLLPQYNHGESAVFTVKGGSGVYTFR